ncbi:type II toxin-antitoxin system prevent-host-death family antitoxin [Glutamicibacter mishrai]|uniref:Type II toxin-antitoxin system prevent-host-death family antitoxin n=1 Tax=Glutamicibacter mishrai TaxID=1775880 RepID=A0A6H0SJ37_9MICC|nr:type II toxin-antitoxin system prevent-host-death family antitoxin [Glutamicibacter mishrai]QIV87702.1 type II toxin-antitoxin system prevent-host-death family antitoxin [Glutamicibacter mishrai]
MAATQPLRISSTVAARKGIGFITTQAQERPVTLTTHGKPIAVVMSAAERDDQLRLLRDVELKVLSMAANLVADRSAMLTTDQVRERLLGTD